VVIATQRRLLLVLALLGLLVLPAGASAHAVLLKVVPAAGAVVDKAPTEVRLTFSEEINRVGARVRVVGPDGKAYAQGKPTVRGKVLTQPVSPDLPEGTTTIVWRVISADGHHISETTIFSVDQPTQPGAVTLTESPEPRGSNIAMATIRALRFTAIVGLIGLVAILLAVWTPLIRRGRERDAATADAADAAFRLIARRLAWLFPLLLIVSTLSYVPTEAWSQGISLRDVFELRQGQINIAMLVLALGALPLLVRTAQGGGRWLAAATTLFAIALACTPGLSGHASAQPSAWLWELVDAVHVLAAGVWGGGLLVLAVGAPAVYRATTSETRAPLLHGIVRRFTRLALIGLVALLLTGTVAAITLAGSVTALWETPWGRIVLAKVVVVVLAVATASVARRATTSFARAVEIEAVLIIIALALTGVLTGLSPQSSLTAAASSLHIERVIEGRTAEVDLTPGLVASPNEVHVIVTNELGQPAIDVAEATVALSLPAGDIANLPVKLQRVDAAHWLGSVTIPVPGTWTVTTHLRIGQFRDEVLSGTITVPPS
jgi:copper transport protein